MTLLQTLEKHIPGASSLVEGVAPAAYEFPQWQSDGSDFLCAYGLSASLYNQARPWLDEEANRRLVFVEDRNEALAQLLQEDDAILLLSDLRVKIYFLQTPLQIETIARQIAWSAVFLKLEILNISQSAHFDRFRSQILSLHQAAGLLLSDAADWGRKAAQNGAQNCQKPFCRALDLRGAFRGVPAIVVGAGPSLEKNRHLLSSLRGRALIFSSSSASSRLPIMPHLIAGIDPHVTTGIHHRITRRGDPRVTTGISPHAPAPSQEVPFCIQARVHPRPSTSSPYLIAPDSHFPFLSWLSGEEGIFDGGWTVGTFMTALAHHWGCNPIVFIGMDYAYDNERKYADSGNSPVEGLVKTADRDGNCVWTQPDWIAAKQWTEDFAQRHSDCRFVDATEGGLGFDAPIGQQKLSQFLVPEIPHLEEMIRGAIDKLPLLSSASRWKEWQESLVRSLEHCTKALESQEKTLPYNEIAYKLLLLPLWRVWRPVFARQLDLDPHKIALEEKMKLNEILFFQQVLEEHIHVCR